MITKKGSISQPYCGKAVTLNILIMNKRKAIFGLVLSLGLLFSMSTIQENTSAKAGWAIVSYFDGGDGAQAFGQGAGATLGAAGAAWAGAEYGGSIGAFVGGPFGMAIGAGLGAL